MRTLGQNKRLLLGMISVILLAAGGCGNLPGKPGSGNRPWPTEKWQTKEPQKLGLDSDKILETELYLLQYPTQAFVLIRHGYIAHEGYYNGFTAEDSHDSYSIAKCFTSAAVGAAIQDGLIPSVDTPLSEFIPADEANTPDPGFYRMITVEHLLTMTSGIEYSNREDYPEMKQEHNWASYVLARPIPHKPGTHWKYKADPTLVSAVISRVTGQNMFEYAQSRVLDPIGIREIRWEADPSGQTSGNGDVYTTARNFARLGYLYLNHGTWDDKAILPAEYVMASIAPTQIEERLSCDCWSETPVRIPEGKTPEYGYYWWCRNLPGVPADAYYAFGGKGQFILVIPSLDIVAVRLADEHLRSDKVVLPEFARLVAQSVLP